MSWMKPQSLAPSPRRRQRHPLRLWLCHPLLGMLARTSIHIAKYSSTSVCKTPPNWHPRLCVPVPVTPRIFIYSSIFHTARILRCFPQHIAKIAQLIHPHPHPPSHARIPFCAAPPYTEVHAYTSVSPMSYKSFPIHLFQCPSLHPDHVKRETFCSPNATHIATHAYISVPLSSYIATHGSVCSPRPLSTSSWTPLLFCHSCTRRAYSSRSCKERTLVCISGNLQLKRHHPPCKMQHLLIEIYINTTVQRRYTKHLLLTCAWGHSTPRAGHSELERMFGHILKDLIKKLSVPSLVQNEHTSH